AIAGKAQRCGAHVAVFERSGIGAGASGVQPGGVRQQWGTRIACRLARESLATYADVEGFQRCGYLFLAHSERTLAQLAANVAVQNAEGVPSRIVSPDEAAELVPGLDVETVVGGSWCAEDGYFDRPQAVVESFGRGLDVWIQDVRSLDELDAHAVVVAAGP